MSDSEIESQKKEEKNLKTCKNCKHFHVTYNPNFPWGCRAFGFMSKKYPYLTKIFNEIEQQMDIDSFIDHIIMTFYCANTSWGHNREWWRPREGDGKWQWLIVDLDRGFNASNTNTNLVDNLIIRQAQN